MVGRLYHIVCRKTGNVLISPVIDGDTGRYLIDSRGQLVFNWGVGIKVEHGIAVRLRYAAVRFELSPHMYYAVDAGDKLANSVSKSDVQWDSGYEDHELWKL